MAITPQQLGPIRRQRRNLRTSQRLMTEINVTPFVDVMLVLLIIFMVTAPLINLGIPVNLPQAAAPQLTDQKEPVTLSINAEGALFLQETKMDIAVIVHKLQAILQANPETKIYVRGDKNIRYEQIITLMGVLSKNGITKVALLTDSPN